MKMIIKKFTESPRDIDISNLDHTDTSSDTSADNTLNTIPEIQVFQCVKFLTAPIPLDLLSGKKILVPYISTTCFVMSIL